MSRSNSAIIYVVVAALVLVAGLWGLNQAGILSFGNSPGASNAPAQSSATKPNQAANPTPAESQPITSTSQSSSEITSTTELSTSTTSQDSQPSAAPLSANASTAAKILARGKLLVGVRDNVGMFTKTDSNGERQGLDIDIAREFAKRWLGDPAKVEFVSVNTANQIPTLINGDVDLVLASASATRDRAQLVDFSQTYHLSHDILILRNDTIVNSLRGLQDKQIAVVQDGSDIDQLTQLIATQALSITINPFDSADAALGALNGSAVDGILVNHLQYEEYIVNNTSAQQGIRIVQLNESSELNAVVLRKGESALRQLINFTLQDMAQDGTLASAYSAWMAEEALPQFELAIGQSPYTSLSDLPTEISPLDKSRLDLILERKKLVAGVAPGKAPFVQTLQDGQLEGFDISFLQQFADRWLGSKDAIEVVTGSQDELVSKLSAGEIDIIVGGVTPQRELADRVDFSQAYMGPPVVSRYYTFLLPLNDPDFRNQVNYVIQDLETEGAYTPLYDQWFGLGSIRYNVEVMSGSVDAALVSDQYKAAHADAEAQNTIFNESAIARIRKRGNQLIAGVRNDAKPFGFVDTDGQVNGFDVELLKAIAEDWGATISFIQASEATASKLVVDGQVDLAASGAPINKADLAEIDYSQSYYSDGDSFLVKRYAGITGVQDLEGKTVAVEQDTGDDLVVQAYAATQKVNLVTVPFNDFNAMVQAVKSGQVDAATASISSLRQAVLDNPDLNLAGRAYTQEWNGIVLPPGDSNFKNLVDASLQKLKKSGKYDEIYRKWFGRTTTPYSLDVYPGEWPFSFADSPGVIDSPFRSKVEQILLKKKIVLGVQYDAAPFGFLNDKGELVGFDVDLAREFAARWLGDASSIQPVRVSAQGGVELLASDALDILFGSQVHSWDKEIQVDFSQSYVIDSQRLLVRASDGISTVADLQGRVVAVISGSEAEKNLNDYAQAKGISFEVVPFQELAAAVAALNAKQVDAVTAGELALANYANNNSELIVSGEAISSQPLSIGVANYDKRFRDLVNFTLQEMKQDGSYARIFAKWFGTAVVPANIEVWESNSYLRGVNLIPMAHIPAGEFSMGYDSGFPDEGPARKVTLDAYYIDQYEVTNHQYSQCVTEGKCKTPSIPRSVNFASYYGESSFGNYPVIWVTWQDASDYCASVGKRLPTEAEWEKAARGMDGAIYSWGEITPTTQANFGYLEKDVASVGKYAQDISPFGVYDMNGNVREWVGDWYQWNYYQSAPSENPSGPRNGVTRVLRGAGWNDTAEQLRLSLRKNFLEDSFDSNLGFRCATTEFPPEQ